MPLSTTELDVIIPEVWDTQILNARYATAVIMPRFLNKSDKVKSMGDIVHIPIMPRWSGGTVTAGTGAFTVEANTLTEAQITINTWRQVNTEIIDNAQQFAHTDVLKQLPSDFGRRLAELTDTDIAGLNADWTTAPVGSTTDPTIFEDKLILQAMFSLANNNIPKDGLSWILAPEAFYLGIFSKDRWTSAEQTGLPKSVLTTNFRFPILGVPAYESSLVATVASGAAGVNVRKCFLAHKESLATAMAVNNKTESIRRTPNLLLSTLVVTQNLYGVITVRANHVRVINIRAES